MFKKIWTWFKAGLIYDEIEDVRAFNRKFDLMVNHAPVHLTQRKLQERIEFLQEELNEFIEAVKHQDLADQADALVDLVYVAKGTAVMMGLPWEDLWLDVQRANMEKARGVTKRNHRVDCIKPPGWLPPNPTAILREAGYVSEQFQDPTYHTIREDFCHDDAINVG
jgi:predicted HAD superfamily Cof-like phosphohydrolase